MFALLALVAGQALNLNVQAPTRFYCDGGIECHRQGSTLVVLGTGSSSGGGGSGGGNFSTGSVTFDGGYDTTSAVDAGWATASSAIVCAPADESGSIEGIGVTVTSRNTGWFVVRAEPRTGRASGSFAISCTGQ